MKKDNLIIGVALTTIVISIVIFAIMDTYFPHIPLFSETTVNLSEGFDTTCVEGHVYYIREDVHRAYFAPKLNNDGTPVICE